MKQQFARLIGIGEPGLDLSLLQEFRGEEGNGSLSIMKLNPSHRKHGLLFPRFSRNQREQHLHRRRPQHLRSDKIRWAGALLQYNNLLPTPAQQLGQDGAANPSAYNYKVRNHSVSPVLHCSAFSIQAVSRIGRQLAEEDVPCLAMSTLGPDYFESGPVRTRMPQRLNKNLSHIGSADPVFESERIFALADFDRSPASRAIRQKTGSNNRVIKPAPPDFLFRQLSPFQCVSLNEVEEHCAKRRFRHSDGRHVQEATGESSVSRCSQRISHSLVFRGYD